MSIKAILFDLDGTLLPLNQEEFLKKYSAELAGYLNKHGGYEPEKFNRSMWLGVKAMILNDGKKTNEECFWDVFKEIYGAEKVEKDICLFERFYEERFDVVSNTSKHSEKTREIIDYLHNKSVTTVLATNPVFPSIATNKRMGWAGLKKEDFSLVTTYENIGFCKPNPKYYLDIASKIGVDPTECMMVGNDTKDDMVAKEIGMDVFLLTDYLINSKNEDISKYPSGGFDELFEYIKKSQEG